MDWFLYDNGLRHERDNEKTYLPNIVKTIEFFSSEINKQVITNREGKYDMC